MQSNTCKEGRSEEGTRTACDLIEPELVDPPQPNTGKTSHNLSSRLPLNPIPNTSVAARPSAFRITHREHRPTISRPNPWRWEFGVDASADA